jgi:hypothetical protein
MIKLDGLHLLLTYQCTFECDHCFVWGSPFQTGTMTIETIRKIISQAKETGSVEWIYFEGGEPFLYYQTMLAGIHMAFNAGFKVGVVTNSYWATSEEDAQLWLTPLIGLVQDLTISSDLFHFNEKVSQQSKIVTKVAEQLGIPLGVICIEQPELEALSTVGQIPPEASSIMFRGRAADKLAPKVPQYLASQFTKCPHEDLLNPGRIHVDPLGNLHICQGISLGNLFSKDINRICMEYDPNNHPIIGALIAGGSNELARRNNIPAIRTYADACHLCYETRKALRSAYPEILTPDQMYNATVV